MASVSRRAHVILRHTHNAYVSLCSRCARFQLVGLSQADGTVVHLFFQYSYDTASEHPLWKELKGASSKCVIRGGKAEFFLLFGPAPPSGISENVSNILLPRPDPSLVAAVSSSSSSSSSSPMSASTSASPTTLLPVLSYQLMAGESEWLLDGRLSLRSTWGEVVFHEAVDLYNSMVTGAMRDYLPSSVVFAKLKEIWNGLFSFVGRRHQQQKGKQDEVAIVETAASVDLPLQFSEEMFFRMIRVAHPDTDFPTNIPSLISRRLFCGASPTEGGSIMRVFHTLADLLGRSRLARRLYLSEKILLASSNDTLDFQRDSFAPQPASPVVFFFRVPRSIVHEPALVLELYQIGPDGQQTPLRPTPYITASQLEKAGGEPLVAFAKLDSSIHIEHLRRLSWDDMLRPCWQKNSTGGYSTTISLSAPQKYAAGHYRSTDEDPSFFDCRPAANHLDGGWWESQAILQPHPV